MNHKPMLSVIIPMYQAGRYIPGTLLSLLRQPACGHLEIICVDDGSTDDTLEKCRWIMKQYPGVRLISLPHGGVSKARNAGIRAASAPYIAFLDADDCWEEDFFDDAILQLLNRGEDVLGFGWATTSVDPEKNRVFSVPDTRVSGGRAFPEMEPRSFCAYFYKKALLEAHDIRFPEDICYNEDEKFKLLCLYHAGEIRFFPRILFTNRLHANSLRTGRYSDAGKAQLIRVWGETMGYFETLTPPAEAMVLHCQRTLETLLDKMNRESCLDENSVTCAAPYVSAAYSAYAERILADAHWHDRLFRREQPILLIGEDSALQTRLGKAFRVQEGSVADLAQSEISLFCEVTEEKLPLVIDALPRVTPDTLLIFALEGAAESLWSQLCSSLQELEIPCLAGFVTRAADGGLVTGGLQQLAADRICQIFSAVEPGAVRHS